MAPKVNDYADAALLVKPNRGTRLIAFLRVSSVELCVLPRVKAIEKGELLYATNQQMKIYEVVHVLYSITDERGHPALDLSPGNYCYVATLEC